MTYLTDDQRTRLLARDPQGYYIGFARTGNEDIDAILSAVAWAAKGWHSTDGWDGDPEDFDYGVFEGITAVDVIQAAANDAAVRARGSSEHA